MFSHQYLVDEYRGPNSPMGNTNVIDIEVPPPPPPAPLSDDGSVAESSLPDPEVVWKPPKAPFLPSCHNVLIPTAILLLCLAVLAAVVSIAAWTVPIVYSDANNCDRDDLRDPMFGVAVFSLVFTAATIVGCALLCLIRRSTLTPPPQAADVPPPNWLAPTTSAYAPLSVLNPGGGGSVAASSRPYHTPATALQQRVTGGVPAVDRARANVLRKRREVWRKRRRCVAGCGECLGVVLMFAACICGVWGGALVMRGLANAVADKACHSGTPVWRAAVGVVVGCFAAAIVAVCALILLAAMWLRTPRVAIGDGRVVVREPKWGLLGGVAWEERPLSERDVERLAAAHAAGAVAVVDRILNRPGGTKVTRWIHEVWQANERRRGGGVVAVKTGGRGGGRRWRGGRSGPIDDDAFTTTSSDASYGRRGGGSTWSVEDLEPCHVIGGGGGGTISQHAIVRSRYGRRHDRFVSLNAFHAERLLEEERASVGSESVAIEVVDPYSGIGGGGGGGGGRRRGGGGVLVMRRRVTLDNDGRVGWTHKVFAAPGGWWENGGGGGGSDSGRGGRRRGFARSGRGAGRFGATAEGGEGFSSDSEGSIVRDLQVDLPEYPGSLQGVVDAVTRLHAAEVTKAQRIPVPLVLPPVDPFTEPVPRGPLQGKPPTAVTSPHVYAAIAAAQTQPTPAAASPGVRALVPPTPPPIDPRYLLPAPAVAPRGGSSPGGRGGRKGGGRGSPGGSPSPGGGAGRSVSFRGSGSRSERPAGKSSRGRSGGGSGQRSGSGASRGGRSRGR